MFQQGFTEDLRASNPGIAHGRCAGLWSGRNEGKMKKSVLLMLACVFLSFLSGCGSSRAFNRGQQHAERGDWDLAIKEYDKAVREDPKNIEYRSTLIRAQITASDEHYKKARTFLKERRFDQAIGELQQALFLNPGNAQVESALKSTLNAKLAEEHYRAALTFVGLNRLSEAVNELNLATELDPENAKYRNYLEQIRKQKTEIEPDIPLNLTSDKPITMRFKDTSIKDVFEFLSRLSGINIIFDEDVQTKKVTVFAKDVSFNEALNIVMSAHKLFMKKLNPQTIMIIPKTKAKMDDYDDLVVKTFYLSTARAKDIANLLRTMLDVKKAYVNDAVNSISVRDTPEKIKLVEKIIAANDLKEAEVIVSVEILEIARSKTLRYGWNFSPSLSSSAQIQKNTATGAAAGISLADLSSLSKENIILTLPGVVVNLIKQDSDAQSLANPQLRVLNNKQAKFHIGDRIPVQTSTIAATTANIVSTNFEYKDIGIKVTVEPTVHLNGTVTLKLNLEISTLGEPVQFGGGQIQFRFGTRSTDTSVNLRDGEMVLIGGLIKDEERKAVIKVPLLGDIPVLGKLFSSTSDDSIKTDILMSITPTIVQALEIPDRDVQHFWSGTETIYDTKPHFMSSGPASPRPAQKQDKVAVLDSLAQGPALAPVDSEAIKPAPDGAVPAVKPADTVPVVKPAEASLALKPAEASAQADQEVQFELSADQMQDLYGAAVTLSYDPKVVDFKTANEGGLLKQDGQPMSLVFSNNVKMGTVDLYMIRIGKVGGVTGSGGLCTVVFQSKSPGSSDVSIKSVRMVNNSRQELKVTTRGAKLNVLKK
jgi:general secretion pathway protein D